MIKIGIDLRMNSVELLKIMRKDNSNTELFGKNKSARKPYNGVSSLYDGEGRGFLIRDDVKKVGSVTNLAESKI